MPIYEIITHFTQGARYKVEAEDEDDAESRMWQGEYTSHDEDSSLIGDTNEEIIEVNKIDENEGYISPEYYHETPLIRAFHNALNRDLPNSKTQHCKCHNPQPSIYGYCFICHKTVKSYHKN